MRLKDKIAIVTGGSQGIGAAICRAYAKEGATVIITNKNHPKKGAEVADKINQEGGRAEAIVCDVVDEKSVKNLIEQVTKKHGRIDILVNNAGVIVIKNFEEQTLGDWDLVMDTNLKGAFLMSQAVMPFMKKQKYGKIIFMASMVASVGFAGIAPYSASKAGMVGMAKSLTAEFAQYNININCISPGTIKTSITEQFWSNPEFVAMIAEKTPSKRAYVEPGNIAGAAVFLASEEASSVHGLDLLVDEGWCAV